HRANLIGANLIDGFRHHVADLIGANFRHLLRNHAASGVGAGLHLLLGNHAAGRVGAGLLLLLADHPAHRVRNLLLDAFLYVADAVDGLLLHFRNPNLFAALPRRALHAHGVTLARAPDATAAARIPRPAAGLADALLHDRAGDAFFLGLPVTA